MFGRRHIGADCDIRQWALCFPLRCAPGQKHKRQRHQQQPPIPESSWRGEDTADRQRDKHKADRREDTPQVEVLMGSSVYFGAQETKQASPYELSPSFHLAMKSVSR
jgi:hypothetical protein